MIENLKDEIWVVHPLHTNYAASNYGRIKSIERDVVKSNGVTEHRQEQLIEQREVGDGYLQFTVSKNGKATAQPLVHRFCYECFHNCIIPDDLEVNHINENKKDNRIFENLELLDHQSNIDYSLSKAVGQYTLDGNLVKIWLSTAQAEREGGFDNGNISKCCNGKRKTHKGYIWQYIEEGEY